MNDAWSSPVAAPVAPLPDAAEEAHARLVLWDMDLASGRLYLSENWSELMGGPARPLVTTAGDLAARAPTPTQSWLSRNEYAATMLMRVSESAREGVSDSGAVTSKRRTSANCVSRRWARVTWASSASAAGDPAGAPRGGRGDPERRVTAHNGHGANPLAHNRASASCRSKLDGSLAFA